MEGHDAAGGKKHGGRPSIKAKTGYATDSLCHAWSAAPLYHIPSKMLGIRPLSAGFGKILIKPNMYELKKCEAVIPTAKGGHQI